MIDTMPPDGHIVRRRMSRLRDDGSYELAVGTAEFGNGTTTVHGQIAATALGTTVDRSTHPRSPTPPHGGHDTGAYGSTGTVVAGRATQLAAEALRDAMVGFAAEQFGGSGWRLEADAVSCGEPPASASSS